VAFGAVADQALPVAAQIDGERNTGGNIGVFCRDQLFAPIEFDQGKIAGGGCSEPKAYLAQARAFAHDHRKGLRADLGVKRSSIAGGDLIEGSNAVGNDAGEDVEASGRAFRIGGGPQAVGQRHALEQRRDVDAARFQDGAAFKLDGVQLQVCQLVADPAARAGQKRGAHAKGPCAQAQVEAGGLQLVAGQRRPEPHVARRDQAADRLHGQNAGRACARAGERFRRRFGHRLPRLPSV
jgi:hypothetical protein